MSVLEELKKILECPVCMDVPRPGTIEIGLCHNGHIACLECTRTILSQDKRCIICRQPGFQIVRGFSIAIKTIQLVANHLYYVCTYSHCRESMLGNVLLQHEKMCRYKPIGCPKMECNVNAPIDFFLEDRHNACVKTIKRQLPLPGWHFVLDMDMVYCFDTNIARVSDLFCPIILTGKCCRGEIESHAFVNMISRQGSIVVYAGWLNNYNDVDDTIQNIRIDLSVFIHSASGKIGQFASKKPLFQGETIKNNSEGVSIARNTLYNWAEWSNRTICPECPDNNYKPHIHVQIVIKRT